ncbi:hypothetical protein GQ55_9G423800 [Panicum hallii var. hallii]|uniref:LysM domain-containing protein n=2 Tax=Panicum hallii TaxID=206008 RepID=A0A2T7CAT1_9POAL|nr:uncharacterized protein LOC112878151 [Panicum hallii]PAN48829.1 hypothetical protein PAHAL_9G409200 [Panicum hallii]PUZ40435.1 hypothetical protein GQ55_9G423800 [Panicum hallii var. hallii]
MVAGERPRSGASDAASWCCVVALVLVVGSLAGGAGEAEELEGRGGGGPPVVVVRGARLAARPCEELYVVAEGETLHGISARCGDPYILERNPHVHDPDDVFPGLVLRIAPRAGGRK